MEVKIEVKKVETVVIDKETLKQECKQEVLRQFEKQFEKEYQKGDGFSDIEIYVDTGDIIANIIDEKYDDWDWAD